jgi:uncharacterized protein YraI/Cu/Zn superoxide dismutase
MRESSLGRQRILLTAILTLGLLLIGLAPAAPAGAQSTFVAPVLAVAGDVKGTATFTPTATGATAVTLNISGFDPVAGSHRFVVTNTGICCPPDFRQCAGQTIAVLPEVQFTADGSASYHVVTHAINVASLTGRFGSALLLFADTSPESDVIACGVIVPPFTQPPPVTPIPPTGPTATVTARLGLNMRQGPGLAQPRILALRFGERVTLTGERAFADGIEWARVVAVRAGRTFTGWSATAFLSGVDTPPPPPPTANVRVTAPAGLRLRDGPGLGFAIRRIVPFGTHLRTTGVRQSADGYAWAQIVIDGLTVWAADAFLAPL